MSEQGWPRRVPGTRNLSCTEDGVLLNKNGKPTSVFTRKVNGGKYTSAPRATFVDEDGRRHTMAVSKLVEAARTGTPPKMGWGKWDPHCDRHKESERAWRERTLAAMDADPNHRFHGKAAGYKAGCRCERCRNANRILLEQCKLRRTLKEAGVNPYTGGTMPDAWRRSSSTG